MGNKAGYLIKTLEPEKILSRARIIYSYGRHELEYEVIGGEDSVEFRDIIKETRAYKDNALYAQIMAIFAEDGIALDDMAEKLGRTLFFLDFKSLFDSRSELKEPFVFSGKYYDKNELAAADTNVKLYFLFRNGFVLDYGDEKRTYLPFESSASMSRQCRMTFVDAAIKERLDERLLLGMDFAGAGVKVKPHKFFAYRGLYMTDAQKVAAEAFELNENTVIVIDDAYGDTMPVTAITAEEKGRKWEIREEKDEAIRNNNLFDGEGFISPAYSDFINKSLRTYGATSYQVRLPFVKGMLHKADFKSFFKEYCMFDESRPYMIKDAFGIERDLRGSEIILTKSMFKCFDWIDEYVKALIKDGAQIDPMKLYFGRFEKYGHSLYIAKTDLSLKNDKTVKINYQFLSTLGLAPEEFELLIGRHKEYVDEIRNNRNKQRELLLGNARTAGTEAWKIALSRNIDLLEKDAFIRQKAEALVDGCIKDVYKGQLRVSVENRFLSGDLLGLLIHIYIKHLECCGRSDDETTERLIGESLRTEKFYMPRAKIALLSKDYYSFLRNPHLSRNEECALRPYAAKKGSLYDKYFGHLAGIVMISVSSLAPVTLGGADFDGDMVKIISDDLIVKATLRDKKEYPEIVRIPTGQEAKEAVTDVRYEHIKDSYGNRIGQISNLAIALGETVYFADKKIEEFDGEGRHITYTPADCTLLTGLEIDAAKNGKHPTENIKEVQAQVTSNKSKRAFAYLKTKNDLQSRFAMAEKFPRFFRLDKKATRESAENGNAEIIFDHDGTEKKIVIAQDGSACGSLPNIEKLPARFFDIMYREEPASDKNAKSADSPFRFQKLVVDKRLDMLYKAYVYYTVRMVAIDNIRLKAGKRQWLTKVYTILREQYDSLGDEGISDYSISAVISNLCDDLTNYFVRGANVSASDIRTTIEKLKEQRWIYAERGERENLLRSILPAQLGFVANDKNYVSLLTNFDDGGYMLLYYILKDVEDVKTRQDFSEDDLPEQHRVRKDSEEYALYAEALDYLESVYAEAVKNKTGVGRLKRDLRERIRDYMSENGISFADNAVRIYGMGSGSRFFWDLLDSFDHGQDIIDTMITESSPYKKWEDRRTREEIFGPDEIIDYEFFDEISFDDENIGEEWIELD